MTHLTVYTPKHAPKDCLALCMAETIIASVRIFAGFLEELRIYPAKIITHMESRPMRVCLEFPAGLIRNDGFKKFMEQIVLCDNENLTSPEEIIQEYKENPLQLANQIN